MSHRNRFVHGFPLSEATFNIWNCNGISCFFWMKNSRIKYSSHFNITSLCNVI
nr:MAG TPA: hypothetical protein [Caudoviricetes sp.]